MSRIKIRIDRKSIRKAFVQADVALANRFARHSIRLRQCDLAAAMIASTRKQGHNDEISSLWAAEKEIMRQETAAIIECIETEDPNHPGAARILRLNMLDENSILWAHQQANGIGCCSSSAVMIDGRDLVVIVPELLFRELRDRSTIPAPLRRALTTSDKLGFRVVRFSNINYDIMLDKFIDFLPRYQEFDFGIAYRASVEEFKQLAEPLIADEFLALLNSDPDACIDRHLKFDRFREMLTYRRPAGEQITIGRNMRLIDIEAEFNSAMERIQTGYDKYVAKNDFLVRRAEELPFEMKIYLKKSRTLDSE